MSSRKLNDKILSWSEDDKNSKYVILNNLLEYLGENLFYDYEPSDGPYHDFISKLEMWLENVSSENDQKLLFELVEKIFYIGREEFKSLNRTAFSSISKRWLFDHLNLKIDAKNIENDLINSINSTWFCPITDSFRINQFYHVNQISSKHTFRPDWRSLKKFGSEEKIQSYITNNNVKYIVLLEDFVGSGTQSLPPLKYACSVNETIPILFIPFVICPKGYENINNGMRNYNNFTIDPIILLKESDLINPETAHFSNNASYKDFLERVFPIVKGNLDTDEIRRLGPFGFRDTGGLTVLYANAPNNSLPVILIESNSWKPLFKRHSRD